MIFFLKPFATFIPHGRHVVEPLFDGGDAMRWVLVPPPGDLGDGGHGALQGATWLGDHGVVAQVEVQRLDDVGGVVFGSWLRRSKQAH